jgi:hypothetical protein
VFHGLKPVAGIVAPLRGDSMPRRFIHSFYERPFVLESKEIRAVIDRLYRKKETLWNLES